MPSEVEAMEGRYGFLPHIILLLLLFASDNGYYCLNVSHGVFKAPCGRFIYLSSYLSPGVFVKGQLGLWIGFPNFNLWEGTKTL